MKLRRQSEAGQSHCRCKVFRYPLDTTQSGHKLGTVPMEKNTSSHSARSLIKVLAELSRKAAYNSAIF